MPLDLGRHGTSLFEDRLSEPGSALLMAHPIGVIEATSPAGVQDALEESVRAQNRGHHLAGFIGYEAGHALEPALRPHAAPSTSPLPLLRFFVYDKAQRLSGREADDAVLGAAKGGHCLETPLADLPQHRYEERIERILAYIRAGDIYQANFTFPMRGRLKGGPLSLYAALRAAQPVAYGVWLAMDEGTLLSLSPELFVKREGDRLFTRPMKGTAARGASPVEDEMKRGALRADEKERAENLMIVDLLRNDLSRVCVPGSVTVRDLFKVETYPTLHTMTSAVEGTLRAGHSAADVLGALFPCGSVTGAPKIRAQEIIGEQESGPRGVYTGAIGYMLPGGDFAFNVAIRTLTAFADGSYVYPVGGGIVADSLPDREYEESLLKARFLTAEAETFDLIETLAWSAEEGFVLGGRHLDRMEQSAAHFHRRFDRAAAQTALEAAVTAHAHRHLRVRLVLHPDGKLLAEAAPLPASPDHALPFVFAEARVDAADPYLRHKTSRRSLFESELERAARRGAKEAVFENQYGEITEGAWTSIFIEKSGRLLTPPLHAGLLPGTLRAELLETGRAEEAPLTRQDILSADKIYLGNSVRGLMPAQLARGKSPARTAALARGPA